MIRDRNKRDKENEIVKSEKNKRKHLLIRINEEIKKELERNGKEKMRKK